MLEQMGYLNQHKHWFHTGLMQNELEEMLFLSKLSH